MSSRDVPEQWAELLVRAELTDPRTGLASMSALGEASGVHPSTISAMMYGDRKTQRASVDKVADAITRRLSGKNPGDIKYRIHQMVGRALGDDTPFRPHPDADLLDPQERQAVNELIRLLTASKRQRPQLRGGPGRRAERWRHRPHQEGGASQPEATAEQWATPEGMSRLSAGGPRVVLHGHGASVSSLAKDARSRAGLDAAVA